MLSIERARPKCRRWLLTLEVEVSTNDYCRLNVEVLKTILIDEIIVPKLIFIGEIIV